MSEAAARWRDLGTRLVSAAVMIALTLVALFSGQVVWMLFVFAIFAAMLWELAPLCDPAITETRRIAVAALAGIYPLFALAAMALLPAGDALAAPPPFGGIFVGEVAGLVGPLIAGGAMLEAGRRLWFSYGALLVGAALFLIYDYNVFGVSGLIALVAIVVVTDTAGYFAGRSLGGPKFWPAVSPKKTWSGTVAGWIGAGLVGPLMLPAFGIGGLAASVVAVALGLASQMGDIAESAMKRRAGLKDSSGLIPGHGGVLDRLDGLVAAACLAGVLLILRGV